MKIISYSLFKGHDPLAELFYVRGAYFNWKMNQIVYPDWVTAISVDKYIMEKYSALIDSWVHSKTIQVRIGWDRRKVEEDTHCMKMLWRMKPIFESDVEVVICRDADALTSIREAKAVNQFISYKGCTIHGISDNPGHSIPLMGGMSGFQCRPLRNKYGSFEGMLSGWEGLINEHGTDQKFLCGKVYEDFKEDMMMHFGETAKHLMDNWIWHVADPLISKNHGSDLCTSFIGSAGCNEMETLRFLRTNISDWGSDKELWKQYQEIFYWHNA